MIKDTQDTRCPECLGTVGWDKQEVYRLGKRMFTERAELCIDCGWSGVVALFPWHGNEELPIAEMKLPDDPFEDTVPWNVEP